ncbi:Putative antirepressor [Pseudomonas chlororaphis subsp. piscium]|uniref:phage antirepressor KilAC domain-containing protein n=1 Tax=Pseudomonas chlororaphis TaxID=587753 RepID=UPI000F57BA21|nr:phage antirepressor KilAC domain-containing protein [Pseudomonas chlororaphis]AZC51806.1 Putative antirepressor [Pseudomonas chlororaphis subsp. piscium]AZD85118.1 Putative antirepressor [Pseudomonas chlororaphis subsp. aureofaciens]
MIISSSQHGQPSVATHFQIQQNVSQARMSSREIADLVGSRHDNVKIAIDRLVTKSVISQPAMQDGPKAGNGVVVQEYLVNKRDSYIIVAQLCPEFTARLVDRWQELEEQVAKPAFDYAAALSDPRTLLALLTENVTKVVALEADNTELTKENHLLEVKVEQDAPKVAFHDMVVVSHKTYNAAQAAKIIGTGRTRLLQFMRQKGWVTRTNEPYQAKIEAGLLDVKLGTFDHPTQGTIPTCSTLITGKGLTKLQAMWQSREADLLE